MTEKTEPVDPENFAIDLTDKCQTHEQWLTVMRFGLGTKCSRDAVRSV